MARTYENPYRKSTVAASEDDGGSLEDMTKDELHAEADRRGVEVKKSATKAELIEALGG